MVLKIAPATIYQRYILQLQYIFLQVAYVLAPARPHLLRYLSQSSPSERSARQQRREVWDVMSRDFGEYLYATIEVQLRVRMQINDRQVAAQGEKVAQLLHLSFKRQHRP